MTHYAQTDVLTGPARSTAESRMAYENQQNACGVSKIDDNVKPYYDSAPLSAYPMMLYRKSEVEQYQEAADALQQMKDPPTVINRFDGLLCDMCVVHSATEAEALAELGWDVSPRAAHGLTDGLVLATSAKDDEIAALKAELARMAVANEASDHSAASPSEPRRGPGRPPKVASE